MNNKRWNQIVKWTLGFATVFSGCFFLVTKSPSAMQWALTGSYAYGDLYRFCKIKRFKPLHPIDTQLDAHELGDSFDRGSSMKTDYDIYFIGDSFGSRSLRGIQFSGALGRKLGASVFSVDNNRHSDAHDRPRSILNERPPKIGNRPRILVLEIVERAVPGYFDSDRPFERISLNEHGLRPSRKVGSLEAFKDAMLGDTEKNHMALLRHCRLWAPVIEAWRSWLFESFGSMDSATPLYSTEPPFLFFSGEVDDFRKRFSDQQIEGIAERAARLRDMLRDEYDCDFLLVPAPNKITLYSQLATEEPYNGFLPRLIARLEAKGVRTVDLLSRYRVEKELLYWPSDTHWNDLGMDIALEEILKAWPASAPGRQDIAR